MDSGDARPLFLTFMVTPAFHVCTIVFTDKARLILIRSEVATRRAALLEAQLLHFVVVKVVEFTYGLSEGVTNAVTPLFTSINTQVTRYFNLDAINAFVSMTLSDVTSRKVHIFGTCGRQLGCVIFSDFPIFFGHFTVENKATFLRIKKLGKFWPKYFYS